MSRIFTRWDVARMSVPELRATHRRWCLLSEPFYQVVQPAALRRDLLRVDSRPRIMGFPVNWVDVEGDRTGWGFKVLVMIGWVYRLFYPVRCPTCNGTGIVNQYIGTTLDGGENWPGLCPDCQKEYANVNRD